MNNKKKTKMERSSEPLSLFSNIFPCTPEPQKIASRGVAVNTSLYVLLMMTVTAEASAGTVTQPTVIHVKRFNYIFFFFRESERRRRTVCGNVNNLKIIYNDFTDTTREEALEA